MKVRRISKARSWTKIVSYPPEMIREPASTHRSARKGIDGMTTHDTRDNLNRNGLLSIDMMGLR